MKKKKVVVALGHKALGATLPEQQSAVQYAARAIADLVEAGLPGSDLPQQRTPGRHDPYSHE